MRCHVLLPHVKVHYSLSIVPKVTVNCILTILGVQAQTMANFFLALEANLTIIPLINKIDLPHANVQQTLKEMNSSFGITEDETIKVKSCILIISALRKLDLELIIFYQP